MSNSDSVDVFELRYTKAEMAAAPEAERLFYLMVTGLANDIQILLRQYLIAVKQDDEDEAKRNASSTVAMLNLRLLAGRFHEGWVLIEDHWLKIAADYEPLLTNKGRDALAELKSHFSVKKSDNIVFMIRNKIGFHSDWKFTKAMFDTTPDDTDMVEYLGRSFGDTLHFGSEVTHYAALKKLTGEAADVAAFGAIMDELRFLQGLFLTFAHAVVAVFARRNLKVQFEAVWDHKRTLTNLPPLETMRIPFFADFSSSVAAVQSSEDGVGC